MKLKNKFISLAAASAATIGLVTPLSLTSCKSSDHIKMTDIKDMSEPSFEKCEETFGDWYSATWAYHDYMVDHPQDFIEDLKWGTVQNWYSFYDASNFSATAYGYQFQSHLKSLKFGTTTPEFGIVWVSAPGQKPIKYPTVSLKCKTEFTADVHVREPYSKYQINHEITCTTEVEYKNMIFFAYPTTRNDKTGDNGDNWKTSGLNKPTWFITFATDSEAQHINADHVGWSIEYESEYTDHMEEWMGYQLVEERTLEGTSSDYIETNTALENYAWYKSFQYDKRKYAEENVLDAESEVLNPTEGWMSWYEQRPISYIINSVMLDSASHYLSDVPVPAEIEPTDMEATVTYGETEQAKQNVYLTNWTLQLPTDYEDIVDGSENLVLYIGEYVDGTFTPVDMTAEARGIVAPSGDGTLYYPGQHGDRVLNLNIPAAGYDYSKTQQTLGLVDWEGYKLNGGKVNFAVPAILNYGFKQNPDGPEGDDGYLYDPSNDCLTFYLPQNYYVEAVISYRMEGEEAESHTWRLPLGFNPGYNMDVYFTEPVESR